MPKISTPSKIAGTRLYTPNVIFSGSTSTEREAVTKTIMDEKGAVLVPPYDHPDIILGQGTAAFEMEEQFLEKIQQQQQQQQQNTSSSDAGGGTTAHQKPRRSLNAVITPLGGGGLLGGTATWFSNHPSTLVFGAEPSFQGADDGRRGLLQGSRIEHVKTLTIADGLRTPSASPTGVSSATAIKSKPSTVSVRTRSKPPCVCSLSVSRSSSSLVPLFPWLSCCLIASFGIWSPRASWAWMSTARMAFGMSALFCPGEYHDEGY